MTNKSIRNIFLGIAFLLVVFVAITTGALADRMFGIKPLDLLFPRDETEVSRQIERKILKEESIVVDIAEEASPSVVTVSIEVPERKVLEYIPFQGFQETTQGGQPQDIGTGFIVDSRGLIVTNKHVVNTPGANYKVITKDDKEYEVKQISRDPNNDIAILKIEVSDDDELKPLELGDSSGLKVGQFVVAIGTALGEFRHTVTTGVISGLGRGITAGSAFEGFVERLDNVIQTDAAINPGNSGGPLINSLGQVIGVNVAVAAGAENVGFAIPVEVVKQGLEMFTEDGEFVARAYLGVRYQMISQKAAIMNEVPQGAFVVEVVADSPAEEAGLQPDDIVTKIDGKELTEETALADIIADKKPGDTLKLEVWRDGETNTINITLSEFNE